MPANVTLLPVELLVLQGTPFCNVDCKYCYLPDRTNRSRMSFATLRATCRQLIAAKLVAENIGVLWHAGEPLALPVDFYETAFDTIEQELRGFTVRHKIQTNGMLISQSWITLFKKWNVSVTISLDGPPQTHDRHRVTRSGKGTGDSVLAGARMLRQGGMGLSVICVLTRDSIEKPDQLFEFFESLGVEDVAFNIDEAVGAHHRTSHATADPGPSFTNFLKRYFELVVSNRSRQHVREFRRGLKYVFKSDLRQANAETSPLQILTVGYDGNFTTFSPELLGIVHPELGPLTFGNVHHEGAFQQLPTHPDFVKALESIRRGVAACKDSCGYFEVCQGGSPATKLGEHQTFEVAETVACKFNKQAVADTVVEMLLRGRLQEYSLPPGSKDFLEM